MGVVLKAILIVRRSSNSLDIFETTTSASGSDDLTPLFPGQAVLAHEEMFEDDGRKDRLPFQVSDFQKLKVVHHASWGSLIISLLSPTTSLRATRTSRRFRKLCPTKLPTDLWRPLVVPAVLSLSAGFSAADAVAASKFFFVKSGPVGDSRVLMSLSPGPGSQPLPDLWWHRASVSDVRNAFPGQSEPQAR